MSDPEQTDKRQDKRKNLPQLFKPGQSGNPAGRPKGARVRFGEKFVTDFMDDWNKHGTDIIVQVREKSPEGYLKAACQILPKLVEFDDDTKDILTAAVGKSINFAKIREQLEKSKKK